MTDSRPRLYTDLTHLWRLLSPPEDYVDDGAAVDRALRAHLPETTRRPELLELGAGGGHTLYHLTERYAITGVDLSEGMLASCRALNPSVKTVVGDMRDVRLDRTFDAVLIHDAVDYLVEVEEVRAALATGAAHLELGGVFLVAPTYVAETFTEHEVEHDHHANAERSLTYFSYMHHPGPDPSRVENVLVYLIREAGGTLEVVEDRHALGLFPESFWLDELDRAGFDAVSDYLVPPGEDDTGVPMFVGTKR